MTPQRRIVWRSLIGTTAAMLLYLGPAAAIPTASAHVGASSTDAARGGFSTVSFLVPNESATNSATTEVTVDLTNVSAVQAESKPGWGVKIDRDPASNTVRSVTWTAAPDAGIPVDQFGVFRLTAKLPDADTVSFPTTQTYADGAVVKWDQAPAPGGAEPEHPVPTLSLVGGSTPPAHHQSTPTTSTAPTAAAAPPGPQSRSVVDNTARILAGAALMVGALGVGLALIVRRA